MLAGLHFLRAQALVSADLCDLVFGYARLRLQLGTMQEPDERIPGAARLYGDVLTDALLEQKTSTIETMIGEPLWPSYTYLRIHSNGASMSRHLDRHASEIGVTIAVGGDCVWPIWFATPDGDVAVELEKGDAVIYEGRLLPHWREPYRGVVQAQCMLFYVRQHGECARWKFDGRDGLGHPLASLEKRRALLD